MKKLILIFFICFTSLAFGKEHRSYDYDPPNESQLIEHKHYKNIDGMDVHSPAHTQDGAAPSGASAKCRDGSYSFSKHHSGTCSHHGGVNSWL